MTGTGRDVDVVGVEVLSVVVATAVCWDNQSRSATLLGKEKGRAVSHSTLGGHVVTKHTLTHTQCSHQLEDIKVSDTQEEEREVTTSWCTWRYLEAVTHVV